MLLGSWATPDFRPERETGSAGLPWLKGVGVGEKSGELREDPREEIRKEPPQGKLSLGLSRWAKACSGLEACSALLSLGQSQLGSSAKSHKWGTLPQASSPTARLATLFGHSIRKIPGGIFPT